jgi:formate C-acetyltransferase
MEEVIQRSADGALLPSHYAIPLPSLPRLKSLREDILSSRYHICTQKASLLTRYFKENMRGGWLERILAPVHFKLYHRNLERSARGIPQQSWQVSFNNFLTSSYLKGRRLSRADYGLHFARAFRYILENMELKIYDHELILGNPSAYRVGAPIHPDLGGLLMLPEVRGINTRTNNPMDLESRQLQELEKDIFPYWFNKSVLALTPLYSADKTLFNTMLEGRYFILTQFSGISHVTPDYPTVLRLGYNGIAAEIREKLEEARTEYELQIAGGSKDPSLRLREKLVGMDLQAYPHAEEKVAFYEAALICAEAAADYGKRWSTFLDHEASKIKDVVRKAELLKLSAVFNRVPAEPAQTFYEALQSVFITHVMLHYESFQHGISFGRMDQYLYPYYKRDVEVGRLTREEAAELIGCFIAKAGELLPLFFERATEYFSGLSSASGITLGGRMADGRDGVNELSFLFLQAYDQVRLRQPNFHVRINRDTPAEFIDLCINTLKKGGGLPAFFNDDRISAALEKLGIAGRDADDYSIVGCVEWGVPGKSFPAAGAIFMNLPVALHLALHNGKFNDTIFGPCTGELHSFNSMDDIITAFRSQLEHLVIRAVKGNNAIEQTHAVHHPTPFLSIVVDGCIEKGVEVNAGGARHNSTGCQGVGLADAVDALTSIEQIVFKEKKMTLDEMARIVDSDFKGHPELLSYILNRVPKYGENEERPNYYAGLVSSMYTDLVTRQNNLRGGKYAPGFWSMTTHQGFGARMGSLPNGRLAGQPLANGVSPSNGRDRNGLTASLTSAANLDHSLIMNGYALNEKLDLALVKDASRNRLVEGLIRGFFDSGGMQVQFNIIDPAILIDAREHPDQYRGLVVRVSGYSAYFNDLTAAMKEELIARVAHECGC